MLVKNCRVKDCFLNFALSLGSICFVLVLVELLFRLIGIGGMPYEHPRYLYRTSDTLGYEYIPRAKKVYKTDFNFNSKVEINSSGLRDYEYAPEKPEGTFRVLVLGDSFTAGLQVELKDTYPKILEEILRASGFKKKQYEVINAGVPGYNTVQELQFLKEKGYKFKPDIVILGFLMSNDVEDNFYGSDMTVADGWLAKRKEEAGNSLFINTKTFIKRYSRVYNFVTNRIKEVVFFRVFLTKLKLVSPELLTHNLELYSNSANEKIKEEWKFTQLILKEMNNFVKNIRSKLLIVAIPCQFQVENDRWALIMERYKLKKENYGIDKPQAMLADIGTKEGITVLDLTGSLRELAEKQIRLYIDGEYHWNRTGHRYVAEEIYNYLVDNRLLN